MENEGPPAAFPLETFTVFVGGAYTTRRVRVFVAFLAAEMRSSGLAQ